jgi:hypothetical protein
MNFFGSKVLEWYCCNNLKRLFEMISSRSAKPRHERLGIASHKRFFKFICTRWDTILHIFQIPYNFWNVEFCWTSLTLFQLSKGSWSWQLIQHTNSRMRMLLTQLWETLTNLRPSITKQWTRFARNIWPFSTSNFLYAIYPWAHKFL